MTWEIWVGLILVNIVIQSLADKVGWNWWRCLLAGLATTWGLQFIVYGVKHG